MTLGVLLALALKRRITLRVRGLLQDSMNYMQQGGIEHLVSVAIRGTLITEGVGALLLMIRFIPMFGVGKGVFYGIFHAISAFCNGGFDLFGTYSGEYSSLGAFNDDPLVILTVSALILIGGLGFVVWSDVRRRKFKFRKLMLHSKLVLTMSAILVVGGTLLFWIFERDNLLFGLSLKEQFLGALFSSVTARTAGFNSIDTGSLTSASKFLTIVFMFIGGCPGSTAGGMKTVTVMVLLVFLWSNFRGKKGSEIFGRRLEQDAIVKATTVITVTLLLTVVATLGLTYLEPDKMFIDLFFEVVSGIGTVGMSTGITRDLCFVSKVILVICMYCGRIGSMSFALFFTESQKKVPLEKPVEKVLIG